MLGLAVAGRQEQGNAHLGGRRYPHVLVRLLVLQERDIRLVLLLELADEETGARLGLPRLRVAQGAVQEHLAHAFGIERDARYERDRYHQAEDSRKDDVDVIEQAFGNEDQDGIGQKASLRAGSLSQLRTLLTVEDSRMHHASISNRAHLGSVASAHQANLITVLAGLRILPPNR